MIEIVEIRFDFKYILKSDAKEDFYGYLLEANNKSERMWRIYFKLMIITCSNTAFLATLSAVSCYFTYGKLDEKFLYHPFKVVLPWDVETAIGYCGEITFHTYAGQGYIFFNGTLLLLFIAICLHHQAFYKVHQHLLNAFDRVDERRNNEEHLRKLINFQVSIRRYVHCKLYNST